MISRKSKEFSLIFVLGMLLLTIWLIIQNNDWTTVLLTFTSLSTVWVFTAMACWLGHVITDALILYLHLKYQQHQISFPYSLYVTVMGPFTVLSRPEPAVDNPCRSTI